ncbi:TonB-dependent receptor plug domain-containing protein [Luteimonas terrae]|uniref:TonB-dependent receptor n=1 Tax=Luteimonas terrae TaxID=1530191 RepID=A0A4R5UBU0_9GAMM|nr:TonB-dependent receptor [Luteimonas terrae]TDK32694.1 TonB-dependent receptor [Luteimonas terrae]
MNSRVNRSRGALRRNPLQIALATALLLPMSFAAAQSTSAEEEDTATTEQATSGSATTLDRVSVTGSRIARDTFNSVSPVQVINREESTLAGFASTTGVLQSNSVTGGSSQINNAYGGFVVNGGPGVNTLSLRGLGATRTLTLMNGRRVSPAGSRGAVGSADLNVLPNIMIERIEVLKDGASSIYGSDAVAGVVNVITRTRVDDTTVEFQRNVTGDGGGDETRAGIMTGMTGDRWHLSGSLEMYQRSELTMGQRGWATDCPQPLLGRNADGTYGADDFIDPATGRPKCWTIDDSGTTINTIGTVNLVGVAGPGSIGAGANGNVFNRWRPNPGVTTGLPGYEGVSYFSRDGFSPAMLRESLVSPTKNTTGFLQGGFDLNALGDAELYFEALGHRRESRQTGWLQHSIDYVVGSPLLPAELRALPWSQRAPADGSTNGLDIGVRAFVDFGNYDNWQVVDFFRATGGVRGNIGNEWSYDTSYSHARSDSAYYTENRLTDRIARSYDVVSDGNGGFVCRDPSGGCVAAPALTAAVVGGDIPQAYRNWIVQDTKGRTIYTESTFNAGVNGPLFDVPAGTVSVAMGAEHRRQEIDDTPDINSINNNLYGFTASQPTRGKDSVSEAYIEFEVPALSGLPFAQELTFNASARYTDYDSYGDDSTWKLGMLYTPVSWLSIRASRGTSFRAPALFEQYLGATSGFLGTASDPCNDYGSRSPDSPRYINCASEGLPTDFQQTSSITSITQGGAETGLAAETSVAMTAGVVIQPEFPTWFGDLSFAADYYDIKVDNGVARLTGGSVLGLCYDSQPSDFNAGLGQCGLVARGANNSLSVTSGYVNISESLVRGWDFTARYVRDIGPGSFRTTAQISNYLDQAGRTFPTDPLRNNTGRITAPQYAGNLDLSYRVRNWQVRYGLDWVSSTNDYDYYDTYFDTDYRQDYLMETGNYFLSSLSLQYNGDDWSATVGSRNIGDKEPPMISANAGYNRVGNAPLYSGYDYFGRTFFFNVSKSF